MRACTGLLFLLAAAATVLSAAGAASRADTKLTRDPSSCPWRTVAHPEDPFIQAMGRWAVSEQHSVLRFDKVESARAQGAGGVCTAVSRNYELIIDASLRAGPGDERYRAVIYVTDRNHPQRVLSFEAVPPPHNG